MDLVPILKRIYAAPHGSEQLEREIAEALGWKPDQNSARGDELWLAPGSHQTRQLPKWTRSLDDAASLLLPDAEWIPANPLRCCRFALLHRHYTAQKLPPLTRARALSDDLPAF